MSLPFALFQPIVTHNGSPVKISAVYPGSPKIVLDSTGSSNLNAVFSSYSAGGFAPHLTLEPAGRVVYQHLHLDGSAPMDERSTHAPHKRGKVIWVCIVKHPTEALSNEDVLWIGEIISKVATIEGVPTENVTDFPGVVNSRDKAICMAPGAWIDFSGIAAAATVPNISRFGPGKLDREVFIQGLNRERVSAELVDFPTFRGRPVSLGSKGKRVELVQSIFGLDPTGLFDEDLEQIVISFKEERGLGSDGQVDAKTWAAMGEYLKNR